MSVDFASWNIEGRLSTFATHGRGTPDKIIDEIERLDADVVMLPEAMETGRGVKQPHEARLRKLGYAYMQTAAYHDGGPVRFRSAVENPSMRLMSKLPFIHTSERRLGNLRSAIDVVIEDPETELPIRVIGVHLDDRNEEFRLRQVEDLELLIANSDIPVVLLVTSMPCTVIRFVRSLCEVDLLDSWPRRFLMNI